MVYYKHLDIEKCFQMQSLTSTVVVISWENAQQTYKHQLMLKELTSSVYDKCGNHVQMVNVSSTAMYEILHNSNKYLNSTPDIQWLYPRNMQQY